MASRIKGITVEIGGDTTGLDKALRTVNSSIKNTQSALKDVQRLLKLDPTNTELLAQKQRLLKEAVASTSEKLEALKEAQKQAKQQLENGDLGQDKYDALQREIIETEEELRRLKVEAENASASLAKIDEAGKKFQSAGDAISDAGQKVSVASTAVIGLGTMAVKTASDFDTAMSKVAAVSGATGEEFDALREKAREMGATTKFSASDAADAMNYMAMAGWKTQDMLDGIDGIMNLAAASGEDLALTSDIVTDALTAFGLTAADSARFADILAAASSNANTNVSMMGETFKYCAPIAGALGFSAEDTAEAIGLMANSGIKASQAGTALRTIMNSLAGEVIICGDSIGEVTIATSNADGTMRELGDILADCRVAFAGLSESEQAAAAEALVGKNAMSGFLAIMNAAPSDIEKLSNAIDNCDGTAENMAKTMQDNLGGQLDELSSAVEELAISFGDLLMPIIRKVVTSVQGFVDKLNQMDEETKKSILGVAAFVAALGPFLIILGKSISAIGGAMQGFVKLSQGVGKLKVAVSGASGLLGKLGAALGGISAPVLAVIAVIAALVAAFATLWKTNDEFRENIISTWNRIKETISSFCQGIVDRLNSLGFEFETIADVLKAIWQGFCDFLAPYFEGVFTYIADTLSTILDVILGVVDVFIAVFKGDWTGAWEAVKGIFVTLWNGLVSWFENILNTLKGVADVVLGWFGTNWNAVWTSVSTFFQNMWNGIVSFFQNVWDTICNVVTVGIMFIESLLQAAYDIITLPFQFIWENCGDTITTVWETIKTTVGNAINAVSSTISTVMNAIKTTISTIWDAVSTKVTTVLNSMKNTVSTVFSGIKSVASTVWNSIKSAISTVVDGIKTHVTNAFNSVKSTISSLFNSIKSTTSSVWNSIKSAITQPIDAAKNHISSALNSIKSFFANCRLSLPHIKLPHFSISGSFSLNPPSVPRLTVSWYKDGGIMMNPTVFGINGSSLMAGGEAGPEAILPLNGFYTKLEKMLDSKLNMGGMEKYLAIIADNSEKGIYLDTGTLIGKLAPGMNRQLGILALQEVYR